MNEFTKSESVTLSSLISKIDSKGRITIPIRLRAKLRLVEGSNVEISLKKNKLVVSSCNGQRGVKIDTDKVYRNYRKYTPAGGK